MNGKDRYRAVVEDLTEVICRFGADGTITFVNEVYCRFFGRAARELIGHRWQSLAVRDDVADVEARLRTLSPRNPVVVIENRVTSGQGKVHWMQFVNRGFFSARGELVETQSVGRDISERKRADLELEQSRSSLRALTARLEAVREQERRDLAREIHDTLGHALTDWKFDLAWLARRLEERGLGARTAIRRRLAAMGRRADAEMDTVRRMAGALRPPLLDALGLPSAIQALAEEFRSRTRIECRCALPKAPPALRPEQETALYRILQEILSNVARHAKARTVEIRMGTRPDGVVITVRDDGCGIRSEAIEDPRSLGLLGMRERAASLGGSLAVKRSRRGGTTVTVRIPTKGARGQG